MDPEELGLPLWVRIELQAWQDYLDDFGPLHSEEADWDYFDRWGLRIAKDIVPYLPDTCYLEFHALRQISYDGKEGVELEYNEQIEKILHL